MDIDVAKKLLDLLQSDAVVVDRDYALVIDHIRKEGFSYATPAVLGMVSTLFSDNMMVAHNLLQNAADEAKAAARINIIAERYAEPPLRQQMQSHAADSLQHGELFAEAVKYTGFSTEACTEEDKLQIVEEVFDFDDELTLFVCQVHVVEIRSWIMLNFYAATLEARDDQHLAKIIPLLKTISACKATHILYTARQINLWMQTNKQLRYTLAHCFRYTNSETWHDLAEMSSYLADNFAHLNKANHMS